MITQNYSTSFHKVMENVGKSQIVYQAEPFKLKTKHVIIGGLVVLGVFTLGYYIGKGQRKMAPPLFVSSGKSPEGEMDDPEKL